MNLPELIKKLNSIDAKDLKNLKQFDVDQIKEKLFSHPDVILNSVMIFFVVFTSFKMLFNRLDESKALKKEIVQLEKKMVVFKEINSSDEQFAQYIRNFPKQLSNDLLRDLISDLANRYNIMVQSIAPGNIKTDDVHSVEFIQTQLMAEKYSDLILFINALESTPYALRLESMAAQRKEHRGILTEDFQRAEFLEVNITLGNFNLKDTKKNIQ